MSSWKAFSGTLIGPHHYQQGIPNQDFGITKTHGDLVLTAVADGAGSLSKSDLGAQLALKHVAMMFEKITEVSEDSLTTLLEAGRNSVLMRNDPELGCTLAIALANETHWAMGTIGDSFNVVQCSDEIHFISAEPHEFANITELVTSDNPHFNVVSGDGEVQVISSSSDGLAQSTIKNGVPTDGFWNKIFNDARNDSLKIDALLQFMDSRQCIHDDTTLEIAAKLDT